MFATILFVATSQKADHERDPTPRGDKNLLFGVLALQSGVITEHQLLTSLKAWTFQKDRNLSKILVDQSALSDQQANAIASIVSAQLALHNNDASDVLKSIGSSSYSRATNSIRTEVEDDEVHASLGHFELSFCEVESITQPGATVADLPMNKSGHRFQILRSHAKGGLGEVFLAHDTELNREVALKEIQERFASSENSRSRFILEAEVCGGLEHPGIVPVYGLGSYEDGRPVLRNAFHQGK